MNKMEKIQLLQDLIKIKTVNNHEKEVALYLQKFLKDRGIESQLVDYDDNRSSLVAQITQSEGKTLVLSGHMDVVEAGDESLWTYPPFSGHIEDDIIWGRGASDMKAGLAALVIAFVEAHEKKNFKGTIRFLATVGEEIGQFGAKQLEEQGYMEKADALLIAEPCNVGIVYAHKGSLNYTITSKGVAAHSSTPELGNNAIEHLIMAATEIKAAAKEWKQNNTHPVLGGFDHNITMIKGGIQVNSIPDEAHFDCNVRTLPEFDNQKVIEEVSNIIDELNKQKSLKLELNVTADLPPVQSNPNSKLIQVIQEVAKENESLSIKALISDMSKVLGQDVSKHPLAQSIHEVGPITIAGTTDAAQLLRNTKDIDFAVYGPGMPMLNHKIDERISLAQYLDFSEAYLQIIEKYLD